MRERLSGFELAMKEMGMMLRDDWSIASPLTIEDGTRAIKELMSLRDRPSAVFICNNLLSLGALVGLQEMGIKCPEDVAIVAFDDHPWAQVSNPPLSVVRQPTYEIGDAAARKILQALDDNKPNIPSSIFNCDLIVRAST